MTSCVKCSFLPVPGYFQASQKPEARKPDVDETPTASPRNGKIDSARNSESNFNDALFVNDVKTTATTTASFNKYDLLQSLNNPTEASSSLKAKSANEHQTSSSQLTTGSVNGHLNLWGKPNVLLIKPFDSNNNNNSTNTQNNTSLYNTILEIKSSSLTPSLLSRDNSTLYAQSTKFTMNDSNVSVQIDEDECQRCLNNLIFLLNFSSTTSSTRIWPMKGT